MSWNLFFKKSAEKELRAISKPDLQRLIKRVGELALNPRPHDAVMLKAGDKHLRIRQGDYRIVYLVRDEEKEIVIIKVGHRREVYD